MIDRSEDFKRSVLSMQSHSGPTAVERKRTGTGEMQNKTFLSTSSYLASELELLAGQVHKFVKDSQRRRIHDGSGIALAQSSDGIRTKLETLSKTLQGLSRIVESSGSQQLRKHFGIILETLKTRYTNLGKTFQDTLQERTKALSTKQTQQANLFGASKVHLSSFTPPAPRSPISRPLNNQSPTRSPINNNMNGIQRNFPQPVPLPTVSMRRRGYGDTAQQTTSHAVVMGPRPPSTFNPYGEEYARSKKDDDSSMYAQVSKYDRSTFQERRNAMEVQNIEKTMNELGQMFTKVATLVSEQGEVVCRIEDDIDVAGSEVRAGQSELLKYYNYISSERALILKIFAVIICLGLFFIIWWR